MIEAMGAERDEVGVTAGMLAHRGDPVAAVRLLAAHGRGREAARLLDEHVVRLISLARYDDVLAGADVVPPAHQTLQVRVAVVDARRHRAGTSMPELDVLAREAADAGRDDLSAWVAAVVVEHLLMDGDLISVGLAEKYLGRLPHAALPSGVVLQARGRLRRVAALVNLAGGEAGREAGRREIDRANADFLRAGCETERWISISLYYLASVSQSWTAPPAVIHALTEARDQLLALGSSQLPFARLALLQASFVQGDVARVREELAALRGAGLAGKQATLLHFAEHLHALAELTWGDDDEAALARLVAAADGVRLVNPAMTGPMLIRTTQTLLDCGLTAEAARWQGRVLATAPGRPHDPPEREVVACRLAMLTDPGADVADRLTAALDHLAAVADPRVTGGCALRAAMTATRTGRTALAERVLAFAERFVPVTGRTGWEEYWAAEASGPGSGRALRLLAPTIEVSVDGVPRRLAPNVARLLVTLAALGRPIGAEELGDALWGDVDPARARGRLKSAIHRLRQALELEPDELVQRDGDVVRLVPHPRWSVDLHEFHRLAEGSPQERLTALRMVGGVLCNAQFPYDDVLAGERAVLETRWRALAADLLAAGLVGEHEVVRRQQLLGLPAAAGE